MLAGLLSQREVLARMSRTVLGIHDCAGPVLIRTNGTGTPSSQDMAVLGSIMTYAEGLGLSFASVSTVGHRLGFQRYKASCRKLTCFC